MKTIILMRHSKPQKTAGVSNESIPLSDDDLYLAKIIFQNVFFQDVDHIYASPYLRALNTAKQLTEHVISDERLVERRLGDETTLNETFWARQYSDLNFKNRGGESLREVNVRMTAFMSELLLRMEEGEKAVVVSHAAAICAYLLNFCSICVLDAQKKVREIRFGGETILSGRIQTPSAFVLQFEDSQLLNIKYVK